MTYFCILCLLLEEIMLEACSYYQGLLWRKAHAYTWLLWIPRPLLNLVYHIEGAESQRPHLQGEVDSSVDPKLTY